MPLLRTRRDAAFASAAADVGAGEGLDPLLGAATFGERLRHLLADMQADPRLSRVNRIAAALYEPATDLVKTFVHASDGPDPVGSLSMRLSAFPGMVEAARTGLPLVVDDLTVGGGGAAVTLGLAQRGYRARCVMPVLNNGTLFGFLFYNSFQAGAFSRAALAALRPHNRVAALMIVHELSLLRTVLAAVRTVRNISVHRDEETGGHLDRMSRYAQIIARRVAPMHGRSDEFVEYLFHYAPLHDVGKVAVPDSILRKPGRLTAEEFAVMQTHVVKGLEIVATIQRDLGFARLPHGDLLRNVVGCHHEARDGSGYPFGLKGDAIPLEGRITTVADVFDALTSTRPYKAAWSNADALAFIKDNAGNRFDPDCVAALVDQFDAVEEVQRRFADGAAAD
ncbi:HD-GYP domain-containing protein [Azospirillum sp. RWY-5-1]|uniref:HD-GYP domain-containing protein n=2 Tax=Azospirillum oleiclasticum TaxID=2735135 RepID=A0ABX2T941_9PROT|nr:HD-GYP domain-containing protein [Azospirillum oleiclasticum]NYZ20788.1 HD-GYP domain-containing protein [Azospirillum oleiclasticum]